MVPAPVRLLLLTLLLVPTLVMGAPGNRTFILENRPAQQVADQLRALYPESELTIAAQGNRLITRGEPAVLDEISQLIETMDVAPVQLRITVRSSDVSMGKRQGGGVSSGHGNVVTIGGQSRTTTTQSRQQRHIVVQDGQSAHISGGQVRTLPVAIRGGRNPAAIYQQVDIRSGFIVTPQRISDQQIELSITAFENTPDSGMAGYETDAVVTQRRVAPGEWVEIGGTSESRTGEQSGITYRVGGERQDNQSFTVKVDIL
ncbi:secretin N-terminal domain-containing protein [Marinobacter segnicrescens]|uniref:secretin N-terminal domain-containing protein n=1 Tax=Marinobacter segnicrescens TaxID=430453 RepID=UPI003A8FCFEF